MKKLLFISYFVFLILSIIYSYLFIDPGLFYLKPLFTNYFQLHRVSTTILFVVFVLVFFGFYALFLYFAKHKKLSKKEILLLISGSGLPLLFAYPAMVSFDIFNYIATAKVAFLYHENPYILMPIAFTHDPMLLFMHAANKTALYAPVWILLTAIPYFLGFGNFLLTLLNFKLFIALFYVGTVWLLWNMTKDVFKTMFFALNPLVLIETFISAHNDIVMIFFLALFMKFYLDKQWGRGILFFLLSSGIKYATLITTPLLLLFPFRTISKEKFFLWVTLCMYAIFFLSSLREEIYPWYALWFFFPATYLVKNSLFTWITVTFTFSLLLRYIPFMLLGTYFGPTPLLKLIFMVTPVTISLIAYFLTQKKKSLI